MRSTVEEHRKSCKRREPSHRVYASYQLRHGFAPYNALTAKLRYQGSSRGGLGLSNLRQDKLEAPAVRWAFAEQNTVGKHGVLSGPTKIRYRLPKLIPTA